MPPLQRSVKMPEPPCSRLPVPEAVLLQQSVSHRLIRVASQGGEAACEFRAAAARLLLASPPARIKPAWGIHTLQGLLGSWCRLGSVVPVGRAAGGSVDCARAFLSLPRKPMENTLISFLSYLDQILRVDCLPVLLSKYLKSCGFLIVFFFSLFLVLF